MAGRIMELAIAIRGKLDGSVSSSMQAAAREASQLRSHIANVNREMRKSQQKIVNIIRKLEDSAEIVISRGGGDEIISRKNFSGVLNSGTTMLNLICFGKCSRRCLSNSSSINNGSFPMDT